MESISHHSLHFGTSKPMMHNESHIWLKYCMNTKFNSDVKSKTLHV